MRLFSLLILILILLNQAMAAACGDEAALFLKDKEKKVVPETLIPLLKESDTVFRNQVALIKNAPPFLFALQVRELAQDNNELIVKIADAFLSEGIPLVVKEVEDIFKEVSVRYLVLDVPLSKKIKNPTLELLQKFANKSGVKRVRFNFLECAMKERLGGYRALSNDIVLSFDPLINLLEYHTLPETLWHEFTHAFFEKARREGKQSIFLSAFYNEDSFFASLTPFSAYSRQFSLEELYTFFNTPIWVSKVDFENLGKVRQEKVLEQISLELEQMPLIVDWTKKLIERQKAVLNKIEREIKFPFDHIVGIAGHDQELYIVDQTGKMKTSLKLKNEFIEMTKRFHHLADQFKLADEELLIDGEGKIHQSVPISKHAEVLAIKKEIDELMVKFFKEQRASFEETIKVADFIKDRTTKVAQLLSQLKSEGFHGEEGAKRFKKFRARIVELIRL